MAEGSLLQRNQNHHRSGSGVERFESFADDRAEHRVPVRGSDNTIALAGFRVCDKNAILWIIQKLK